MDKTVEPETSGPKLQIQSAQDEKSSERTLNAKPTIPKALVNIPANDARVARRCMMLLHLLERDSQRVLESKKIKDPSLEIKWLKFDVCQEAEELKSSKSCK
jgi:hypothetical protein